MKDGYWLTVGLTFLDLIELNDLNRKIVSYILIFYLAKLPATLMVVMFLLIEEKN